MPTKLSARWSNQDFLELSENFDETESFWGYVIDIEDELPRLHDAMIHAFVNSLRRARVDDPDIVYWGGTPMSAQYALQGFQKLAEEGLLTKDWMESDRFTKPKATSLLAPIFTSLTPEPEFVRYFNYKYFPGYKEFWKASEGEWEKPKDPEKGPRDRIKNKVKELGLKILEDVKERVVPKETEPETEPKEVQTPEKVQEDRAFNTGKLWAEYYVNEASPDQIKSYTDDQIKQVWEYGKNQYPDDEGFQNHESFSKGFKEILNQSRSGIEKEERVRQQAYDYGFTNADEKSPKERWEELRGVHKDTPPYLREEYFEDFKRGVEESGIGASEFSDDQVEAIAEKMGVDREVVRKWIEEGRIN